MKSKIKKIKFIDLFAGLGGIRLGFEQAFNENGFKSFSFPFQKWYQGRCCEKQSNGLLDTVSKNSFDYWGFHFCCVSILFNFFYFKCS